VSQQTYESRQEALEEITAYLTAMRGQMEKQLVGATESGLTDTVSDSNTFDLRWFLSQADTMTLQRLQIESKNEGMPGHEVMRALVELDGKRRFGQVIEKAKTTEKSALCAFWATLAKNPIVGENGWTIERVAGASAKARVIAPPTLPKA
jgi:hypothetical protein